MDRANRDVSAFYRPLHPAVLRLIQLVVEAGRAAGRPVAVCGELASDPLGASALIGLGVTDLSVTPVAIPELKDRILALDAARARGLAHRALEAAEAAEVERILGGIA